MNISDLLQGEGLKFLKWVEIITDENQAVKTSAMYILQKDLEFCDIIFVSDKGKKRKIKSITIPFLETIFTKLDASNIEGDNIENWRDKLSIYSKSEIEQITMLISEFVNNGKIRADKIESLGLTEIIPTTESTINNFILNYNDFEFQKNDIIGILTSQNPDEYSLYIFIGGDKSLLNNYLPTGLTKITVGMVEGLNDLLNDRYTKSQSDSLYMALADYIVGGKIRADKIEALGLTTLIEVSQTSLASFAANSANYVFEQNDIIAIPDGTGNFALFIFKGGTKTVTANYLPTGLTNITIAMVEGLQTALDSKVQKPAWTGGFFASQSGTTTTWVQISPASYYLNLWDGSNFRASVLYQNGTKLGIGTQTPSEMLHLQDGRLRAKAIVLDVNSETLPNQITTDGTRFSGASSGGTKRGLMYNDYADFLALSNSLTDAQKTAWKTSMNGGWTTNTMSVATLFPNVVNNNNNNAIFITILGANLNLNPAFAVISLINITNNSETIIPNSQVTYGDSGKLTFWFRPSIVNNSGTAEYAIKLFNGVAQLVTSGLNNIIITDTVNSVDLSALTWNKVAYKQSEADNVIITSGGSVGIKNTTANTDGSSAQNLDYIGSAQSNVVANAGENFSLRGYLVLQNVNVYKLIQGSIGLISAGATNTLLMNMLTSLKMYSDGGNWFMVNKSLNEQSQTLVYNSPQLINVRVDFVINKRDNNVSFSASHNSTYNGTTLVNNTVSKTIADSVNIALSVKGSKGNSPELSIIGVFEEMYKF